MTRGGRGPYLLLTVIVLVVIVFILILLFRSGSSTQPTFRLPEKKTLSVGPQIGSRVPSVAPANAPSAPVASARIPNTVSMAPVTQYTLA